VASNLVEIDALWATWVEDYRFDPKSRSCTISLTAVDGTSQTTYVVIATGVRSFRYFNDYPGPGDVLEATEVFLDRDGENLRLVIECWGPDAGIELVARGLTLDGEVLDPDNAPSGHIPARPTT
jgi:hypothetical protein